MEREKIIEKALNLLKEGRLEEYESFLIENFKDFSKEIQIKILSSLIEAHLLKEKEKLEILNKILDEILKV